MMFLKDRNSFILKVTSFFQCRISDLLIAASQLAINKFAELNVINPTNRPCEVEV